MPKLQPPQNLSSSLRVSLAMCQNMPLVPAQRLESTISQAELWHLSEAVFRGEKTWWAEGLREYWERAWDLVTMLRGIADVKSSPPSSSDWSKHTENSLLQLCKLFLLDCNTPTAPYSHSKSAVSLAIFRGKLKKPVYLPVSPFSIR